MSITRTIVTAECSYQRIFKDRDTKEIKTEKGELRLINCRTRERAEILLNKKFKGDITELLNVQFHVQVREITDKDFMEHSTVKSEKILTE